MFNRHCRLAAGRGGQVRPRLSGREIRATARRCGPAGQRGRIGGCWRCAGGRWRRARLPYHTPSANLGLSWPVASLDISSSALAPRMTGSTLQRLRLLALVVATSAVAGSLYAVIRAPPEFNAIMEIATGATMGGVISDCIIGFELFGVARLLERGGRRLPLIAAILLRTIVYGVVIMAALLLVPWVYSGERPSLLRPGLVGDVMFSVCRNIRVRFVDVNCAADRSQRPWQPPHWPDLSPARGTTDRSLP